LITCRIVTAIFIYSTVRVLAFLLDFPRRPVTSFEH